MGFFEKCGEDNAVVEVIRGLGMGYIFLMAFFMGLIIGLICGWFGGYDLGAQKNTKKRYIPNGTKWITGKR